MTGKNSHLLLWLQYGLILSLAAGLVCCTRQTGAAASEALTLCIQTLIPSLLPFFIVSSLTVSCGVAQRLSRAFHRPMQRLFGLPGVCAPALILGLMGGYPVGARTVGELLQQKLCTRAQAQQLLRFCNNCGPAFILGAVGSGIFGSTAAGLLLYITHILAAILTGLLLRPWRQEQAVPHTTAAPAVPLPFHRAFTGAVTASVTSVLNVCGFVIFFAVAVCLLRQSGVLPLLAGLLPLQDGMAQALLIGSLEMTNGV